LILLRQKQASDQIDYLLEFLVFAYWLAN